MSNYFGNQSRMVTPDEIPDIHPYVNVQNVAGGIYAYAEDGSVDPTGRST